MRFVIWLLCGWLCLVLMTALQTRCDIAHVAADPILILLVFFAMRWSPTTFVPMALALGYCTGRAALAPLGLHELALGIVSVGVCIINGHVAGSGARYFAAAVALAQLAYAVLVCGLLLWQGHRLGFSSWTTALLFPNALLSAALAWLVYRPLMALEAHLSPSIPRGLDWR